VWVGPVAFAAAAAALFASTLAELWTLWNNDPNYNHGFVVLPVSVGLAYWIFRKRAGDPGPPDRRLAWMALVMGGLCHLAALLFGYAGLDFLALFFVARGGLLAAGGREWAARFTFPLAFLVFMFPLPPQWLNWAALTLQDVAARVSETVLDKCGVPVVRNGHNLRLAGVPQELVVAEECSGTRQIVAFVAMAALLGYFSSKSVAYRVILLLLAVPVAVVANVLRVTLMNAGAYWFGTGWMGGWMHHIPALFSLPVGFLLFLSIDRTLRRVFHGKPAEGPPAADAAAPAVPAETPAPSGPALPTDFGRRWLPAAAGVGVLVALALLFEWHISAGDQRSYPPMPGRFAQLPLDFPAGDTLPGWRGKELEEEREETRAKLPFTADDLAYRGYVSTDGNVGARLYLVHSRIGEDRKHHPEVCIREVSGAPEVPNSRAQITLNGEGRVAQRFRYKVSGGQTVAVYYWHYTFQPSGDLSSPFQQIHQGIGTEKPSVTAQLTAPGNDPRALELIEKSLLPQLDAALMNGILPPDTPAKCDRLPVVFVR
jgi:exosortase